MTDTALREAITKAIEAPMRSQVSTADIRVMGISSTKMSEIVFDIEALITQAKNELLQEVLEALPEKIEPLIPNQHTVSDSFNYAIDQSVEAIRMFMEGEEI